MSQSTGFHTSPSRFRKSTNASDRSTKVREAVRKYDMLAKTNSLPSTNRSSPTTIQENENNDETTGSSSSSSTDSSTSESATDRQVSVPNSSAIQTQPQISTTKISELNQGIFRHNIRSIL